MAFTRALYSSDDEGSIPSSFNSFSRAVFSSILASYSDSKGGQSQSSNFYRGGLAAVYLGDASEVYVTLNPGNPSAQCLVVLDSQIGVETQNLVVDSGSKLSSLPQLSKDGYIPEKAPEISFRSLQIVNKKLESFKPDYKAVYTNKFVEAAHKKYPA